MVDTYEELNLDQKVTVRSIAGWETGFAYANGLGEVRIPPNGTARLSRNEIISQIQNGNKLFVGVNGDGSHATLFIDDAPTRKEVGFDSEDGKIKQIVFNDAAITKIFALKTQSAFEKNLTEAIKTRAEKYAIIQAIERLKINDYNKIRFVEDYTGFRVK